MTTTTDEIVNQQFDVGPGGELSVSNISGRIEIRAGEGAQITVQATKHGKESAQENTEIEMTQEGGHVSVKTKPREQGFLKTRGVCSVHYEIEVPRDCEVHARGVSADVIVAGTGAGLRVETVSGDVRLEDVAGDCSIGTVSGNVDARSLEGPLRLRSTSGDAEVRASRIPDFNCHSVSGDLTIETPLTQGEHYYAKTVSGNLRLLVPAGTGATVQMRSVSGNVQSDLPAEIIHAGRRNWQGRINGGGANVEMHTVSGNMRISPSDRLAAEEGSGTTGEAPNVAAHRPDAMAILEELERGDITVEDAMTRLKALR